MPVFSDVKSDGNIEKQPGSAAVRDSRAGKGRFDLITPFFKLRIAKHYENGAKKYGDNNWVHGMNFSRYFESAERHLNAFQMGLKDEDHLAAAAWNIMCIIDHQERIERGMMNPKFADMPLDYSKCTGYTPDEPQPPFPNLPPDPRLDAPANYEHLAPELYPDAQPVKGTATNPLYTPMTSTPAKATMAYKRTS